MVNLEENGHQIDTEQPVVEVEEVPDWGDGVDSEEELIEQLSDVGRENRDPRWDHVTKQDWDYMITV